MLTENEDRVHKADAKGNAFLQRYLANQAALQEIKVGDVRKGWRCIAISYCSPWGFVLLSKGGVVVRQSPRGFREM